MNSKDNKEKVIGEFKPKRKFISFLSSIKNYKLRLLTDSAYITGDQLSGVLDGSKFKITICDEGTINFEVVENKSLTTNIDTSMLQRLIDQIDEIDVVGYAQKFVVSNLEFYDTEGNRFYLEVEHERPIDRLSSLFDKISNENKISERGLNILDSLLGSDLEEEVLEKEELEDEPEIIIGEEKEYYDNSHSKSYIKEQFDKMNEYKIIELKSRIEKSRDELNKSKIELKNIESKINKNKKEISLLESRLEEIYLGEVKNGHVFYISELIKNEIDLDDKTIEISNKISDLIGLKKELVLENLKGGYYIIKIAKKEDFYSDSIDEDIINKVINLDDKISMIDKNVFRYSGNLDWHELTKKMLFNGFEQNSEFNKKCDSNSYVSSNKN